jgi:hypothetical protein
MSQPPGNSNPTLPERGSGNGDALAQLYRMSRTAGLGAQEYVAVNTPAVASTVFGLASFVVLFDRILLVVPLAGVVLGLMAIRQIRNSNGTQTGLGLAILGIVLSLGLGAYKFYHEAAEAARVRADEKQISAQIEKLGSFLASQDYDSAYALFSPKFQKRVSLEKFKDMWERARAAPFYGPIRSAKWNGRLDFNRDQATGAEVATGMMILQVERKSGEPDRRGIVFAKGPQGWQVDDIPEFFPQQVDGPSRPGFQQPG